MKGSPTASRSGKIITDWLHAVFKKDTGEIVHLHYQLRLPETPERVPHAPTVVLGMLPTRFKAEGLSVIAVRFDVRLARETRRFRVDVVRERLIELNTPSIRP
jgi:hypothetical protein